MTILLQAMRRELAVSRQVMYASDDKLSGKKVCRN